ncbi:MAG TPA: PmoA family protein [Abditibacterium sp.]|jgi:hypothetical protein
MQLIHALDSHLELEHEGVALFRYVYRPRTPQIESPRPYFHPLRTLKGNIVSGFRPHDHRWHHGLSMTSAFLNGQNFWGGPTFKDGKYRQLENNGQQTKDWKSFAVRESGFSQEIAWLTAQGEWILGGSYQAQIQIEADFWQINIQIPLENTTDEPLHWGSPTTQGRENAGYGGLFWRGPRDFLGGQILMSDGREGAALMGEKSPWLAYIGKHDESDAQSTLVFVDNPKNPRYPTPWFVRNTEPMVCPNFAFHEEYIQNPGEVLTLNYKILIADGAWSRERIEREIEKI